MALSDPVKSGLIGVAGGLVNTGIQRLFTNLDKDDEQQWWYEQQKYLEEHNSPAYRAMLMKQAGLNPFTEVSSVPLGNVDSSLPRTNASHTFDVSAIQNSLLLDAQRENIEQDTKTKASVEGLNEEKKLTETEWRSNIIQQTLNLKQDLALGLISEDTAKIKFSQLKDAYDAGYNEYLIDWDLAESTKALNDAEIDYRKAQEEYLNLKGQIASEQNEKQKAVLEAQADALKASATQSYAQAVLAHAQSEVAKSTKLKLDNDVKLANNEEARKAAMHLLNVAEQQLINHGLEADNIKKHFQAERERISQGHVENLNDVGNYILWTLQSFIPFAPTPNY